MVSEAGTSAFTAHFLSVGQGDAILLETPHGKQVLIDGDRGGAVIRALGEVLPSHDDTIDIVIATHPDADHIGGLVFSIAFMLVLSSILVQQQIPGYINHLPSE